MAIILIYIHAFFGALALISGGVAISTKKGSKIHKRFGKIFYYTMLLAGTLGIIVSLFPNHFSPFLLAVGVFSNYMVITGYRCLSFKTESVKTIDYIISYSMILTAVLMISLPLIMNNTINIVLCVFGFIGGALSIKDLILFRKEDLLKKRWLKLHVEKICGGYIAAITAFLVVNNFLPGIIAWLSPTVLGAFYITYWSKKLKKN